MEIPDLKRYRPHITASLLLIFMAIALLLRIIPALVTRDQSFFPIYDTDTWYNLRQIEVMVHSFPQYNWFDPMTAYPEGKVIDWGPAYPFIASVFCLLTGATTHTGIIAASGLVSPLMAILMVPAMYYLGTKIGDWKTGIAAAGLVSFSSFVYFTFSSFGMVDHHIAEVLTGTLFLLVYITFLDTVGEEQQDWKFSKSTVSFCCLAALAGILYFTALVTSTTVLILIVIVAVFTFVQSLLDFLRGRQSEYLCILNLVMLGCTSVLLIIFGFRTLQMNFMSYSPGLVALNGAIAAETVGLYIMSKLLRGRRSAYLLVLTGLILVGILFSQVVPALRHVTNAGIALFSGSSVFSVGIEETLPWSFSSAFDSINLAIILTAGGFIVLGYYIVKKPERKLIFFMIWSVFMLFLTIRYQRFQYYLTVNIVILSALCITEPFRWEYPARKKIPLAGLLLSTPPDREQKPEKQQVPEKPVKRRKAAAGSKDTIRYADGIKIFCIAIVCILTTIHAGLSLSQDLHYASDTGDRSLSSDWLESLRWLSEKTPDPGIGYFDQYERVNYTPPAESYGILAIWDAGHWITFFSHRLPVTNPFQDNLAGKTGAAAFFLSDNETQSDNIRANFRAHYVITDSSLAVDQFTNLVPWVSGSVDISRYIKWFLVSDPSDPSHLRKIHLFDNGYFQTMAVRLYAFDGSLAIPGQAEYVRYIIREPTAQESSDVSGYSRVITDIHPINLTTANGTDTPILPEGPELLPTSYADIFSTMPDKPVKKVPALSHYRLVHESPSNASVIPFPESESMVLEGIRSVKIFEYVNGARIPGEGIVEIPIVTDTGREFMYRQESSGGEFVVPYSTQGNPYGVRAAGPYHIIGTSRSFEVPEDAVMKGLDVTTQ